MVNMKDCVKGSTVHFRCGGSAVVEETNDKSIKLVGYFYDHNSSRHRWYVDGAYSPHEPHPLDIVKIDDPAFNLEDIRPGMAFIPRFNSTGIAYYIGKDPRGLFVMYTPYYSYQTYTGFKHPDIELTRYPSHDIEVPK